MLAVLGENIRRHPGRDSDNLAPLHETLPKMVESIVISDGRGSSAPSGDDPSKEREQLSKDRDRLLGEHCADMLDMLSLADELVLKVRHLQQSLVSLREERLPTIEKLTSADYIERQLIRPHRERSAVLRSQIKAEHQRQQRELFERTIKLLRSNVSLATCLRLVGTLRQQPDTNGDGLVKIFLEARASFITDVIEDTIISKRDTVDGTKLFEAILRVMRESVLDVISQYKALFTEPYPLCRFIVERMAWFLSSIETLIKQARNTLILASYWNQLVVLNAAYAGMGAAFLPLIETAFVQQAKTLLSQVVLSSLNSVQNKLAEASAAAPKQSTSKGVTQVNAKEIRAPIEILQYPVLVLMVNSFVDIFDQIRAFALPALRLMVHDLVLDYLKSLRKLLDESPSQAANPNYREQWIGCFEGCLSPFIIDALELYFPSSVDCGANLTE